MSETFTFTGVVCRDFLRLDGVSIHSGSTSIVGPSGSGKSTVLRLLTKLISPDAGTIAYRGTPLAELDSVAYRRRVALLSQTPIMFAGSILDNVNMALALQSRPTLAADGVTRLLERLQLAKDPATDVAQLSGGERQRVALARLLASGPEVFLLDEPSSALDEHTAEVIVQAVSDDCHEHGRDMVLVTHSPELARRYSDAIIRLDHGQVAA